MKQCVWCEKELTGRQRKYCSSECDNEYFRNVFALLWWSNARKLALERAGNKCERCGSTQTLEVHHKEKLGLFEPRHNSSKNRQDNLIVLCRNCHEKEHHPQIAQIVKTNKLQMKLL